MIEWDLVLAIGLGFFLAKILDMVFIIVPLSIVKGIGEWLSKK